MITYITVKEFQSYLKNAGYGFDQDRAQYSVIKATELIVSSLSGGFENDLPPGYGEQLLIDACRVQAFYIYRNYHSYKFQEQIEIESGSDYSDGKIRRATGGLKLTPAARHNVGIYIAQTGRGSENEIGRA